MDLAGVGLALLGGLAVAGVAYAVEGIDMPKWGQGLIQLGVGTAAGTGVSMVSKPLGLGIAGGGAAVGLKNVGEDLAMMAAKPAATTTTTATNQTQQTTSAIRANFGRVRQLPARTNVNDALGLMRAIRARV